MLFYLITFENGFQILPCRQGKTNCKVEEHMCLYSRTQVFVELFHKIWCFFIIHTFPLHQPLAC